MRASTLITVTIISVVTAKASKSDKRGSVKSSMSKSAKRGSITEYSFSGNVNGYIRINYLGFNKGAHIEAKLDASQANWTALTESNGNCIEPILALKWHLHTNWTNNNTSGFLTECSFSKTGNHTDPGYACGPASEHATENICASKVPLYNCTPSRYEIDKSVCEQGDLSGKLGDMIIVNGVIDQKWTDLFYEPYQSSSMVLHAACNNKNTPRFACAKEM